MITAYLRGHQISFINNIWIYSDTKEPIENNERRCSRCGHYPTKEGYDHCLGFIPGATHACCGHGVEKEYVKYD